MAIRPATAAGCYEIWRIRYAQLVMEQGAVIMVYCYTPLQRFLYTFLRHLRFMREYTCYNQLIASYFNRIAVTV